MFSNFDLPFHLEYFNKQYKNEPLICGYVAYSTVISIFFFIRDKSTIHVVFVKM